MGYDYYNPFFAAVIIGENGKRYPLWTGGARESDADVGLGSVPTALAYLESVEVEIQLGHVPRITATLSPPFRASKQLLSSPLVEWGRSELEVQFGYTTGGSSEDTNGAVLSPTHRGVILKPQIDLGTESQITLEAQGVGYSMTRQQSGRTFNNTTRFEILKQLIKGPPRVQDVKGSGSTGGSTSTGAEALGVGAVGGASQLRDKRTRRLELESRTEIEKRVRSGAVNRAHTNTSHYLLFEEEVTVNQGHKSDWMFAQQIVRQARCTMTIEGSFVKIRSDADFYSSPPTRTFRLYDFPGGDLSPSRNEFPILQVSSPTTAVYLPGSLRGMTMKGVDSETREPVTRLIGDAIVKTVRTASTGIVEPLISGDFPDLSESGEGGGNAPGSPSRKEAIRQAEAEYQNMTSGMGVKLQITSLLDPELLPGDVIAVRGVSSRHDHNYGVMKARFSADSGGGEMSIEAVSNISKVTNQAVPRRLEPEGPTNDNEPRSGGARVESPDPVSVENA